MRNVLFFAASLVAFACGGPHAETKPAKPASAAKSNPELPPETNDVDPDAGAGAKAEETAPKADPCTGADLDLGSALMQSSCEVPNPKPDEKSVDMKGKLAVSLAASTTTVAPGGHVDLVLTLANKSGAPLPLYFTIDPTPRFPTETFDKTKHRVDKPLTSPPPLPKGVAPRKVTVHETARVTLAPNGAAKITVPWNAVKMRWAPEKLRGSPPEEGYPRVAAGNLSRGQYTVRIAMPIVLVSEGIDHEWSAPKTTITVK